MRTNPSLKVCSLVQAHAGQVEYVNGGSCGEYDECPVALVEELMVSCCMFLFPMQYIFILKTSSITSCREEGACRA